MAGVVFGVGFGGACHACSESGSPDPPVGPVTDSAADRPDGNDALSESTPDARDGSDAYQPDAADASDGCSPFARPATVPADWEEYTGWSCGCRLYVPGKTGQMPEPIEWEACAPPVPQSLACRWMKHTWHASGIAESIFPNIWIDRTADQVLLQFSRFFVGDDPNIRYRLVAEADGPVRLAFLQANPINKGCELGEVGVATDRYLYRVLGDTWDGPISNGSAKEGILGGELTLPYPTVVRKQDMAANLTTAWEMSEDWLLERTYVEKAWPWDLSTSYPVYDPATDPDHLPAGIPTLLGKQVFVEVGDMAGHGVMSWTDSGGLQPLIRYFGEASRIAANFGTDGTDMVWTYGEGLISDGKYAKLDVMTAPYTTDATQLQATARRVRSDLKSMQPDSGWKVGCGYAARAMGLEEPYNNALFIVRLSDGRSWLFQGSNGLPTEQIDWEAPLGFTCQEYWGRAIVRSSDSRIIRVRLDSLGPGTPPD